MSAVLSGLRAWTWQRLSAVFLALYFVWAVAVPAGAPDHEALRTLVTAPFALAATGIFFLLLLVHAWVGMRDVVLDYVHPFALRVLALALVGAWLAGCGLWALVALVRAAA